MAVPSDAVWEVRASGTGVADTNGSGYSVSLSNVGTSVDYSQQNSPQVSFTSGNSNIRP